MSSKLAPRYWGGHLLGVLAVGIALGLGLWQFGAWQAHRDAEAVDLTGAAPVPLADVIGPDDPFPADSVGRPVVLEGTWVPAGTVYVSGREVDGQPGYWVVTPLAIDGQDGSAVPVVRGWIAEPDTAPAPPTGSARLDAWLQPPEGTGQMDEDPADDVLPQMRMADLVQRVDQDLYGAYGVAQQPGPGLEAATPAQLPEVGALTSIRNLLYGIEWWVFGAFAAFIWWRWVREPVEPEAPGPSGAAEGHPVRSTP